MPGPLLHALAEDARDWCKGRLWIVRAPLLLVFAWWLWHHWRDYEYWPVIMSLNFGIHELGHVLFSPMGKFMGVLGGSLLQCVVPIIGVVMFLRQRDYFAIAFALVWLGTNLFYVGTYCLDANDRLGLALVSIGGGEATHDWYYLLETTGLLAHDTKIAWLLRAWASVTSIAGIALGTWLCVLMARSEPRAFDD